MVGNETLANADFVVLLHAAQCINSVKILANVFCTIGHTHKLCVYSICGLTNLVHRFEFLLILIGA